MIPESNIGPLRDVDPKAPWIISLIPQTRRRTLWAEELPSGDGEHGIL
jgi:hypothetical protein